MLSTTEDNRAAEMEKDMPIIDELDDRPEIKFLRSPSQRACAFIRKLITTLLSTTDVVEDVGFEAAPEIVDDSVIYLFGILRRVAFIGVFLAFFVTNYVRATVSSKFVALQSDVGNCNSVPMPWTLSSIGADFNGYWEGQTQYSANLQIYSFSLFNFVATDATYRTWIRNIQSALKAIGEKSLRQDLGLNLIYWSSWVYNEPSPPLPNQKNFEVFDQTLTLNADPSYIMRRDYTQSTIGNVSVDCYLAESSSSYSLQTAKLTMAFNVPITRPSCEETINLDQLGYDPTVDGSRFAINLDVYTIFSAMAVAYRVNGPQTLAKYITIDIWTEFTFNGVLYQVVRKYDSLYPQMAPMFCLGPKGGDLGNWNCLIKIGKSFGIPYMMHAGALSSYPEKCDCSTSVGQLDACNQMNLLAGAIVYDVTTNQTATKGFSAKAIPFLPAMNFFYVPPLQSAAMANEFAFFPAWAGILGQGNQFFTDQAWRENVYTFALTNSFGYGTMIMFQVQSTEDQTISATKLQLVRGACNNAIVTPNFPKFFDNYWGPLIEGYYECTLLPFQATTYAAGIAVGVAQVLVPTAVMMVMYLWLSIAAYLRTEEYVEKAKEDLKSADENMAYDEKASLLQSHGSEENHEKRAHEHHHEHHKPHHHHHHHHHRQHSSSDKRAKAIMDEDADADIGLDLDGDDKADEKEGSFLSLSMLGLAGGLGGDTRGEYATLPRGLGRDMTGNHTSSAHETDALSSSRPRGSTRDFEPFFAARRIEILQELTGEEEVTPADIETIIVDEWNDPPYGWVASDE